SERTDTPHACTPTPIDPPPGTWSGERASRGTLSATFPPPDPVPKTLPNVVANTSVRGHGRGGLPQISSQYASACESHQMAFAVHHSPAAMRPEKAAGSHGGQASETTTYVLNAFALHVRKFSRHSFFRLNRHLSKQAASNVAITGAKADR